MKMKYMISNAAKHSRMVLFPSVFSLSVHSFTDPALTPPAQPNVHTPPAPALYWNCSKAVKTASFSHSLHPQRAGLKRTLSHTLTNTHSQLQQKKGKKKGKKKGEGYSSPYTDASRSELQWVFQTDLLCHGADNGITD